MLTRRLFAPDKATAMSDSDADPSFIALPLQVRRHIDRAFDSVASQVETDGEEPAQKKRRLHSSGRSSTEVLPGGFLPEDNPAPGGFIVDDAPAGGFLPEDTMLDGGFLLESSNEGDKDGDRGDVAPPDAIPLSLIPSALQLLDLQPDDEDVLSVFRNAATGWENKHGAQEDESHLFVSRKDWRAVCTALLDVGGGYEGDAMDVEDEAVDKDDELLSEPSEEEYVESETDSELDEEDEDSDDEYQGGGFMRTRSSRKAAGPKTLSKRQKGRDATTSSLLPIDDSDEGDVEIRSKRITARQKAESRRAFAMFFPDVPDAELETNKIMIKDITRMASSINLKLSAEEVSALHSCRERALVIAILTVLR